MLPKESTPLVRAAHRDTTSQPPGKPCHALACLALPQHCPCQCLPAVSSVQRPSHSSDQAGSGSSISISSCGLPTRGIEGVLKGVLKGGIERGIEGGIELGIERGIERPSSVFEKGEGTGRLMGGASGLEVHALHSSRMPCSRCRLRAKNEAATTPHLRRS